MVSAYPKLVPPAVCHTYVRVVLQDGMNRDGTPKVVREFKCRCNYSEKSRQVMSADRQLIELSACALFDGDIAPGIDLSGEVAVLNAGDRETVRRIYRGEHARNPDGTVNFTKLELI